MTEHPYDVEVNPWVGGRQRFEMVSEADPSVRTGYDDGRTRLVVREGPHPPGTAELGRQAWEMMLPKLASLLDG
jgi:hypothetical protein